MKMTVQERPLWKFELETPEIGNPDDETCLRVDIAAGDLEKVLYGGQTFYFESPFVVEARARWADADLEVNIKITAALSSPCSRCLEPSRIEILEDFLYLYSLRDKEPSVDASSEDDFRVVRIESWRRFMDITDQVWESFILSLPLKVLCSPDCGGLCPRCGRPLNGESCGCGGEEIDPRLEKLAGLKIEDPSE